MSTNILLFALYCHVLPILCIDMNNSVYRVISMKPANASILRKINRKLVFGLIFFCSLSVLLLFYYKPDTSPDTDNQSAPVPEIVPDTSVNYVYDNIKSTSVTLVEINGLTHDLFINDRYTDVKKLIFDFFKHKPKNTKNKYKI